MEEVRLPRKDIDVDSLPYGAGGLPYGGEKTPYSRKKPHKDGGGSVTDYNGPTLPIPDRLPNWGDVGKAVDIAKGFLTPPDPYEAAGHAVEQYRAGNPIDAAVTLASSLPLLGNGRAPYERKLSPQGFYSHGAESAYNLPQETMTVQQARKMLEKAGTKPDEFRWSGFENAYPDPMAKVNRADLVRHFEENVPQLGETILGGNPVANRAATVRRDADQALLDMLNDVHRDDYHSLQSAADVADRAASERGFVPPKFGQYTLPGGENYREVLTTLQPQKHVLNLGEPVPPGAEYGNKEFAARWGGRHLVEGVKEYPFSIAGEEGRITHWPQTYDLAGTPTGETFQVMSPNMQNARFDSIEAAKAAIERASAANNLRRNDLYKSSHWDEPNVLNHLRMSDRPGGVLHLEELQSDWGQEARRKGIKQAGEPAGLAGPESDEFRALNVLPDAVRTPEQTARLNELYALGDRRLKGVPDAPYIASTQNWTDLGLKRALYEAAKANAERLAWTPGAEQAARYDLSKQIDELHYAPHEGGYYLTAVDKKGDTPINQRHFTKDELPNVIGKEVADKIMAGHGAEIPGIEGGRTLSGLDLSVGGEGMKGYYDKILPSRIQAVLKRIGVNNPEFTMLKTGPEPVEDWPGQLSKDSSLRPKELPSLVLTPEMLAQIRKGMPYFADGGAAPSAAITGPHTITADDLIGRASYSTPSQGTYTDAGGQKIAAPYVTSMRNGYPVYGSPASDSSAFDPMSILSQLFGGKSYGGNNAISNALNVAQSITPYTKVA